MLSQFEITHTMMGGVDACSVFFFIIAGFFVLLCIASGLAALFDKKK